MRFKGNDNETQIQKRGEKINVPFARLGDINSYKKQKSLTETQRTKKTLLNKCRRRFPMKV